MWQRLAWKWYCIKYKFLFSLGVKCGWITFYERQLIERLRDVNCGGLPASVVLLVRKLCDGHCYDRVTLISLGMDKFEIVWGNIRELVLRYGEKKADHCWIERDGWVYDTSWGLRCRKWLYYLLESPQIGGRSDSDWWRQQKVYQDFLQRSGNFQNDRHTLSILVPQTEVLIDNMSPNGWARYELELFKETCGYDQIKAKMEAAMMEA